MALLEEHLFGHSDVAMPDFPGYYQQLSNKSDLDDDSTKLEVEFRVSSGRILAFNLPLSLQFYTYICMYVS